MRSRARVSVGSGIAGILMACLAGVPAAASPVVKPAPVPAPDLTPTQAVEAQLAALAHNDQPGADAGVAVVYAFSSPGNRSVTGPLPRFAEMIHHGYAAMIDHRSASLKPVVIREEKALQGVELVDSAGEMHRYVFVLSLQHEAPYAGCWMTDSVFVDPAERATQPL